MQIGSLAYPNSLAAQQQRPQQTSVPKDLLAPAPLQNALATQYFQRAGDSDAEVSASNQVADINTANTGLGTEPVNGNQVNVVA